jgi:hypothetical protein
VPQLIKQTLLEIKTEIDTNTIDGDINTPLSAKDVIQTKKKIKDTSEVNDTVNQMDIYRVFHPTAAK